MNDTAISRSTLAGLRDIAVFVRIELPTSIDPEEVRAQVIEQLGAAGVPVRTQDGRSECLGDPYIFIGLQAIECQDGTVFTLRGVLEVWQRCILLRDMAMNRSAPTWQTDATTASMPSEIGQHSRECLRILLEDFLRAWQQAQSEKRETREAVPLFFLPDLTRVN